MESHLFFAVARDCFSLHHLSPLTIISNITLASFLGHLPAIPLLDAAESHSHVSCSARFSLSRATSP